MFYTIYKTINLLNGKFYIGKHQTENIHDLYYGSGSLIKSAISKYGKKNFKKEILFVFDNELEMNEKEKELVNEELINQINTYNVGIGGEGGPHFKGKKHSIDNIEKMIANRQDYSHSIETREKFSELNKNRIWKDESRKKISEKAKERFLDPEYKKLISNSLKAYHLKRKIESNTIAE